MTRHRLSAEELALWQHVTASVAPLHRTAGRVAPITARPASATRAGLPSPAAPPRHPQRPLQAANTLDANWDKKLATGRAAPDRTIDLHGHTLASAHAWLNQALGHAIRSGDRLVLLVTGKPASGNPRLPPVGRGAIRASVADWLAASPYSGSIAAIRAAHPRHGGAGALYLVLRRSRG